jgi:hypothetical protein
MNYRTLKGPVKAVFAFLFCAIAARASDPDPRSVTVVIAMDSAPAGRAGAFSGAKDSPTPRLDRFAKTACVFASARAQSPSGEESLSTLTKSMHPARTKADRPGARTLAQVLRAAEWSAEVSTAAGGFDRGVPAALRWLDARADGERALLLLRGDGAQASVLDARLAPLLDRLDEPRWRDRAVVVVLALRGEADANRALSEEALRVPLLVRAPGFEPRRLDAPVGLVDVMPTLLELAEVKPDFGLAAQMEGVSLAPLMRGEPMALDSFAEADSPPGVSLRSIVTRDGWKGVLDRRTGRLSLYRLADDPRERTDVFARFPGVAAALLGRLIAIDARFDVSGSSAVAHGMWKAVRDGGETRLYDLSSDPYLTSDEAAREPTEVLALAGEFMRPAAEASPRKRQRPSPELLKKLRDVGYW